MLGCYDFCGHYDWTFAWLRREGGAELERAYWREAIAGESQRHAADLIGSLGFAGMAKYWAHTLDEEAAGYTITRGADVFRIDMHRCPSRGFLMQNGIGVSTDYCEIIDVRAGLESMAGYLATLRISDEQLTRLEKIAKELDELDAQGVSERLSREAMLALHDKLFALDSQFHMGIAQVCGNRRILALLEQQHLLERSFIIGMGLPPRRQKQVADSPKHMDIVKELRKGNPKAVRDMILASLMGTKDGAIRRYSGYQIEHIG